MSISDCHKNYLYLPLSVLFCLSFLPFIAYGQPVSDQNAYAQFLQQSNGGGSYVPLTSIGNYVPAGGVPLSTYLQNLFKLGVAVCTGLAVIMIVIGGMEYMTTDAIGGKSEGIAKIESALWGLALVLVSYILLKTINPDFLKGDFTVQQATGVVNPIESSVGHLDLPPPTTPISAIPTGVNTQYPGDPYRGFNISSGDGVQQTVAGLQAAGITNPNDIAAILGHVQQESDFSPLITDPNDHNGGAEGAYQVSTNLFNQFRSWASDNGYDPGSLYAQAYYFATRMQQSQPGLYSQFINAQTPTEALQIFEARPGTYGSNNGWMYSGIQGNRYNYAERYGQTYQSTGGWTPPGG